MPSLNDSNTFMRRQLFKQLLKLPKGKLMIEEGEESFVFGESENSVMPTAKIVMEDVSAYRDMALRGSMGAAESYMQGKWTSPDLVSLVRLMSVNINFLNGVDSERSLLQRFSDKLVHWLNRNTEKQARDNISRHYDLSNEFFALFLDPEMMYSSAIFPHAETSLDEAALHKLDVVCRKLDLQKSDHLLEIGTGWGGLAIYAAKNYGCRVTTTTISREQYDVAVARVDAEGLAGQVTVLFDDYRKLVGRFDKLVSIEMIEAVGYEYYEQYFSTCNALLKGGGVMLLQAITIPGRRFERSRKSVDFISRYIFPGGSLPSHELIISAVKKHTDLEMVGMQEIGQDYAKTLAHWRAGFLSKLESVRALGFDEHFIRMWDYYLCYCQGGFEERAIGTSQILLAKPDWRKSFSP